MLAIIKSMGLSGLTGYTVDIETDINSGLPSFDIVGLGDTAIKESRERVRSAVKNSGYSYPLERITVNLAPADKKKEGVIYDVAVAMAILQASEQIPQNITSDYLFFGELSLKGEIRHINGLLPLLISARENGFKKVIIPYDNRKEASYIEGISAYAPKNLKQLIAFLKNEEVLETQSFSEVKTKDFDLPKLSDFAMVKGQKFAKRAVEIAASGGHNILLLGPPGAGKTMISKCIPSIMPTLSFEESLETTKIHSIAGELDFKIGIVTTRPFRAPHHTASAPAIIGGGRTSKPGEISLAHNGVLYLDELPEYPKKVIETLRQPLEDGVITVARAQQTVEYPAKFMLVSSMNPCPCGNYGSKTADCRCTQSQIIKYLSKLSGPIMDRIDLHVEVDGVGYHEITSDQLEESSQDIKKRVTKAREIQLKRFSGTSIFTNASMSSSQLKEFCNTDTAGESLLKTAFENLKLTARAYTRILKVSRTIADLDGSENIRMSHIAEAIQYRTLDRKYRGYL